MNSNDVLLYACDILRRIGTFATFELKLHGVMFFMTTERNLTVAAKGAMATGQRTSFLVDLILIGQPRQTEKWKGN